MRSDRLRGLDGIRGLAALGVLLHHVWWYEDASSRSLPGFHSALADDVFAHLRLGVTVFFVLSGFLLYRPFVRASLTCGATPSYRRYFLSRTLRIVPAYWVALAATVLLLFHGLAATDPGAILRNALFGQIYVDTPQIVVPAWTLCIEVSFYLALPFLALGIARYARGAGDLRGRALRHCVALGLVAGLSLGYWMLRANGLVPPLNLAAYISEFIPGMVLATLYEWRAAAGERLVAPRLVPVLPVAGLALAVAATLATTEDATRIWTTDFFGLVFYEFLIACSFALILAAIVARPEGRGAGFLSSRTMAWLGAVSYGFYLWHQPLLNALRERGVLLPDEARYFAVNVLFVLVPSLLLAAASWRWVERPALRLKERAPAPTAPVAPPGTALAAGEPGG
ncbi:MAG TPA: acyltransferase [Gaiellaceae bacterium]